MDTLCCLFWGGKPFIRVEQRCTLRAWARGAWRVIAIPISILPYKKSRAAHSLTSVETFTLIIR